VRLASIPQAYNLAPVALIGVRKFAGARFGEPILLSCRDDSAIVMVWLCSLPNLRLAGRRSSFWSSQRPNRAGFSERTPKARPSCALRSGFSRDCRSHFWLRKWASRMVRLAHRSVIELLSGRIETNVYFSRTTAPLLSHTLYAQIHASSANQYSITFDPRNILGVLNQCPFLGEEAEDICSC